MKAPAYLSWENFCSTVFVTGEQRVHRISDQPRIDVFGDGVANRIGLQIETSEVSIPPELCRLSYLNIRNFTQEGRQVLELTATASALQRQFYHFSAAVAERVLVEHRSPIDAVTLELRCFTDLLAIRPLLAIERQIGLAGELVLLERLIEIRGIQALDAWIGPTSEPHDFRLGQNEFEVKTTVAAQRIHTIGGQEQLTPSHECRLYLVSVMLGPAGADAGFTLKSKVEDVIRQLRPSQPHVTQFLAALGNTGFRSEDADDYSRRYALRRALALLPVDEAFPAITRPVIEAALGARATRIESLRYDVNLEGLVQEDGSAIFREVIPTTGGRA